MGRRETVKQTAGHLAVDTEWPVKVDVVFTRDKTPAAEVMEEGRASATYAFYSDTPVVQPVISRDWIDPATSRPVTRLTPGTKLKEQRVLARLAREPGKDFLWMLYPRNEGETLPPAKQLAPGVMKVATSQSTDYVFLSTRGLSYSGEDVTFDGGAGSVRLGKDGTVTLALVSGAGRIGYKGFILEGTAPFERTLKAADLQPGVTKPQDSTAAIPYEPQLKDHQEVAPGVRRAFSGNRTEHLVDAASPVVVADGDVRIEARRAAIYRSLGAVRFVAPERTFAQLTVGDQGVRGVGPFNLTFTAHKITGTVDGDIRTLVTTRPRNVVKPMYHMDGWRYYAGHADDSSADNGRDTPQFSVAFGVTAGKHTIEVAEWTFPSLPPSIPRKVIE